MLVTSMLFHHQLVTGVMTGEGGGGQGGEEEEEEGEEEGEGEGKRLYLR